MTLTHAPKVLLAVTVTARLLSVAPPAHAEATAAQAQAEMMKMVGFVPEFVKVMPDSLVPGYWEETKAFDLNDKTALDRKTKDLIGLAIAAQLPSHLTVWSYRLCARASGVSVAETDEAVALSALGRHWSTFFNGMQLDETKFRAEIAKVRENAMKAMSSGAKPPAPLAITDTASVYKDAEQSFGFVPEFVKRFPVEALPGAWLTFRNVELNPHSALPGKIKSLIGLAVSSQIPCRYCIIADTEFAKLDGATDREVTEAVTAGAMVRQYITLVEGLGVDEKAYRRDWERLTSHGGKGAKTPKSAGLPATKAAHLAKAE
jgi:AhpD family alkylhydroperoxidase